MREAGGRGNVRSEGICASTTRERAQTLSATHGPAARPLTPSLSPEEGERESCAESQSFFHTLHEAG
jgi:hypothetical protein